MKIVICDVCGAVTPENHPCRCDTIDNKKKIIEMGLAHGTHSSNPAASFQINICIQPVAPTAKV